MKFHVFYFCLSISVLNALGQTQMDEMIKHPPIIKPSPEAQSFQRYGEYPVDFSTGIPKIEIPLFEVSSGKLSLPISLSYHASGIRVGDIASVVGLGWRLNAGGVLTRTIKGYPDESFKGISGQPIQTTTSINNSSMYNQQNYNSTVNYLYSVAYGYQDAESDDYSYFAGTGLEGGFVYDNTGNIVNTPASDNKVIKHVDNSGYFSCWYEVISTDGTHYLYEQKEQCKTGIDPDLSPTSWWLTKIISADQIDKIEFEYDVDNVDFQHDISVSQSWDFNTGINGYNDNGLQLSFHNTYTHRVLLKKIKFDNGSIVFNYLADRKDLTRDRLHSVELYEKNNTSTSKIYVLDQSYFYSGYTDDKYNYRLKFEKIHTYDKSNNEIYNNELEYYEQDILPPYMYPDITYSYQSASYAIDFFGYYNGAVTNQCLIPNLPTAYSNMNPNRVPNIQYTKACTLKKIKHPTGGSTEFNYSANIDYQGQVTGGLRISTISSKSSSSSPAITKRYSYANNLLHMDMDSYASYNYPQVANVGEISHGYTEWRNVYTDAPVIPHEMYNGSFALYQIVDEYLDNTSNNINLKTEYTYSSEPNIVYPISCDRYQNQYFVSRAWRRGQLQGITSFNFTNGTYIPLKSTYNEYSDYRTQNIINGIKILPRIFMPPSWGSQSCGNGNAQPVTDCYFYFNTSIETGIKKLIKQYSNDYDNNGNIVRTELKDYTYASANHLFPTKTVSKDSKGNEIKVEMQYPYDFISNSIYSEMVSRNIISPIIVQTKFKNNQFVFSNTTNYNFWNGSNWSTAPSTFILPQTVEQKKATYQNEVRLRYHSYDDHGNVTTISKENDVKTSYLWGYDKHYPVAEVVGQEYSVVSSLVNQGTLNNPSSDNALRAELDNLRINLTSTKAQVKTYTYKPLVGMTSQTDPSGKTTYYEYDGFGRLAYVKDQNHNVIKKYCYNYAGQPEDCSTSTPVIPSQPVYVRLERQQDYAYSDEYYQIESTEYVVRFYSNAAGTVPFTLTNDLPINYTYYWTHYDNNGSQSNSTPGVLTGYTGTHESYDFGYTELNSCSYYGTYSFDCHTQNYNLSSGTNYTIIN